jgi:hypothetical protein
MNGRFEIISTFRVYRACGRVKVVERRIVGGMQVDLNELPGRPTDGQSMDKTGQTRADLASRKVTEDEKKEQAGAQNCAEEA